jgi:hypothetical protein
MNYIVGLLLLFLPSDKAFLMLVFLIEYILPPDYYSPSMIGMNTDAYTLVLFLKSSHPQVHEHVVVRHQIDLTTIVGPWFLCLFAKTLPIETCMRVWDCFLFLGSKVLFRVALALFHLNATAILNANEQGTLFNILSGLGKNQYDCDQLIQAAFQLECADNHEIDKKRKVYRTVLERHMGNFQAILSGDADPPDEIPSEEKQKDKSHKKKRKSSKKDHDRSSDLDESAGLSELSTKELAKFIKKKGGSVEGISDRAHLLRLAEEISESTGVLPRSANESDRFVPKTREGGIANPPLDGKSAKKDKERKAEKDKEKAKRKERMPAPAVIKSPAKEERISSIEDMFG